MRAFPTGVLAGPSRPTLAARYMSAGRGARIEGSRSFRGRHASRSAGRCARAILAAFQAALDAREAVNSTHGAYKIALAIRAETRASRRITDDASRAVASAPTTRGAPLSARGEGAGG